MADAAATRSAIVRIGKDTSPKQAGGSIAKRLREQNSATVQAVGAGAVHQTVKALAVADSLLSNEGLAVFCRSQFRDIAIDNKPRTAILFRVVAVRIKEPNS